MEILEKITNIDGAIVFGFLLLNLLVGVYFSRGITNIREYAVGKKNFSMAAIVSTIIGTWIGCGSFSFTVHGSINEGLYFIIPGLAVTATFIIIALFYAPRMQGFLGKLSVADAMGEMYGNTVRMCTAIFSIVLSLCVAAAQFVFLNAVITEFIGMHAIYTVLLSSIIIIIYSALGGIRAVTFTDMVQFLAFGVTIPVTAFVIWYALDDNYIAVLRTLEANTLFNYKDLINVQNTHFVSGLMLFLFFLTPELDPTLFQRISIARNVKQAMKSFFVSGLIMIFYFCIFAFIGILLLSDNAPPSLDPNNIVPYIFDHYLTTGLKGIFITGIIAICISTADSYICVITIMLAHDLTKAAGINISPKGEIAYIRIIAVCTGIVITVLGTLYTNILDLMKVAYSFYMPIVSVPLTLAIFGFRTTDFSVLLGMFAGFIIVCYTKFFTELDPIASGILANLTVLIGSHYLLRPSGLGWIGVQDDGTFLEIKKRRREYIRNFFSALTTTSISSYLQGYAKRQKATVYLGFFCSISLFCNLYSLPKNVLSSNHNVLNVIAYITLFLSTVLITYPAWSTKFKNPVFISSVTHVAIFNMLVGCSIFVLINNFGHLQIIVLSVTLMMAAILLSWQVAVPVMILGVVFAAQFYKYYICMTIEFESISIEFSIFYVMLMVSLICVVLIKPKEDALALLETKSYNLWQKVNDMDKEVRSANNIKTEFITNINHEVRTPMTGITSLSQALWDNYDRVPESKRRECVYTIAKNSERLISLMNNILDFSNLQSVKIPLHLKKTNITELVHDSLKRCKKLYLEDKDLHFKLDIEKDVYLKCDAHYIGHTIDNLIINAISYSRPETTVTITLKQQEDLVCFAVRDEGIGIPKEELATIFKPFTTSTKTQSPAGGRGVGLALCYAAITAHKGRIYAESDGASWAEFSFEI